MHHLRGATCHSSWEPGFSLLGSPQYFISYICKILVCMFPDNAFKKFKCLTSACERKDWYVSPCRVYLDSIVQLIFILYDEIFFTRIQNGPLALLRERKKIHIKDMKCHVPFYLSPLCCSCHSCVHSPQGDHKEELCERMQLPKSD